MVNGATITVEEAQASAPDELLRRLETQLTGLTSDEAQKRMALYGPNELPEKKANRILRFFKYFWGPIPWMIEVAAALSAVTSDWKDFILIMVLLVINAGIGYFQESRAEEAIELLKQKLALKARALRDNAWRTIESRLLVPGDIIRVRLGDIVPADLKLMEGEYLLADESGLTGESLPVEKKPGDIAYSGSIAHQGEMNALVIATGASTFFGRTAKLIQQAPGRTHFQTAVMKIADYLIALSLVVISAVFGYGIAHHQDARVMLQFSLVLVVASIPVALPAVLSVTMAAGASKLAKKEAIVRRLVAVEELAGMDVLCADKTGTMTENRLTVADIVPFGDYGEKDSSSTPP